MKRKASQDLAKLTDEWYNKLKRDGFKDIEWYNPKNGAGQNTPYLKDSALNYKYRYNQFIETHFRLMQNYCTHATNISKKDRLILQMYCDGLQFRTILRNLRRLGGGYYYNHKGKVNISLFTLHHLIKRYISIAYEWNKKDINGHNYSGEHIEVEPYFEYCDSQVDASGFDQQEED